MAERVFQITDESETEELGGRIAELLMPGDVVGLRGDLGAGKTFLCGVVAARLGLPGSEPVSSPTFTLINEYMGARMPIYHMDLYRLGDPDELYELGVWEYYDGQGVCMVEWCDKFDDLWPGDALVLTIGLGEGERRTITAQGEGRGAAIVEGL